jgi:hypothetical protein
MGIEEFGRMWHGKVLSCDKSLLLSSSSSSSFVFELKRINGHINERWHTQRNAL